MNYLKTFLPYLFGNKKGESLEFPLPPSSTWNLLSFEEQLIFHSLSHSIHSFVNNLDLLSLSLKEIYHLLNFLPILSIDQSEKLKLKFFRELQFMQNALNASSLTRKHSQELINFKTDKLTIFVFLKKDRKSLGKLLVRKPDGTFLKDKNQNLWSIPILGLSGRGLNFNHSNGCTPMGVYTIDSVMPEANKQSEFGKYRRLIMNFIPSSHEESQLLQFLPVSHQSLHWWKQSVLGRELGRNLLRIHGTGRRNSNIFSPYYPFVPTSGCLATNEASFFGLREYQDQRLLLDALMESSGLEPLYENESKIQGLLYVLEFDDNLSALYF